MLQLLIVSYATLFLSLVSSEGSFNALTHNGLFTNGVQPNGLTPNGFTPNGLTPNGITPNGLTGNGLQLNGLQGNGIQVNGMILNGIELNGLGTNGLHVNGIEPNGIHVNGIHVNGIEVNGVSFSGVYFNGKDESGNAVSGLLLTNVSQSLPPSEAENLKDVPVVVLAGFTLQSLNDILANFSLADPSLAELMPYLVRCSLEPTDSWVVKYNGTTTTYTGEFGLAPSLVDVPLTPKGELSISACLMAHVNYFGKHVYISTRRNPSMWAEMDEMNDFGVYEGAFFGNIFTNHTQYTCTGLREDLAMEQSADRALRLCTEDMKCLFHNVGKCEDVCEISTAFYGYSACRGSDGVLYPAANVFLKTTSTSGGPSNGFVSIFVMLCLVFVGLM